MLYSIDTTFVGIMIFVRPLTGDDKQEWSRAIRIQLGMRGKKPQVVLLTSKSKATDKRNRPTNHKACCCCHSLLSYYSETVLRGNDDRLKFRAVPSESLYVQDDQGGGERHIGQH